jgi:hypothetical protein
MASDETATVHLGRLVRDPSYQVRGKLDDGHIRTLMQVYKSGRKVQPIAVAEVGGRPVLVDGWHRVEAMRRLGRETADAIVSPMGELEARWKAAEANLSHGLRLKPRELRSVFHVYIRTKKHIKPNHRREEFEHPGEALKSYREMGAEIGVSHNTIRNWMEKDFPSIFRKLAGDESFVGSGGLQPTPAPALAAAREAIGQLLSAFGTTSDDETRSELMQLVEGALRDMQKADQWRCEDAEEADF